ncbi:MAG: hypothetical protein WD512_00080, partial [Candidatus Paceibacterota bacterium]
SELYWDLAAVGIIADSAKLSDPEARYIINEGLANINNQFLRALVEAQAYSLKGKMNNTSISFYIAPLINAVVRVGSKTDKIDMFRSFIEDKELVDYTNKRTKETRKETISVSMARRCKNLKAKQARIVTKALDKILEELPEEAVENEKAIVYHGEFEDNLTGLIAMKVAGIYRRPTLIIHNDSDPNKTDVLKGSARNYDLNGIDNLKDIVNQTNDFEYALGHQSAFGVSLNKKSVESIRVKLNKEFADYDFTEIYNVDFSIPADEFDKQLIFDICDYEDYWGKGVEEPFLHIKEIPLVECEMSLLGKKSDTIAMEYDGVKYMIFKTDMDTYEKIKEESLFGSMDIIGKANVNEYEGKKTPQIMIQDFEIN